MGDLEKTARCDFWNISHIKVFMLMFVLKDNEAKIEYPTTIRLVKWIALIVGILSFGVMLKYGFLWYMGYVAMSTWAIIRFRRSAVAFRRAYKETEPDITLYQYKYLFIDQNRHSL
jgi:hypothetical protein